MLGEGGEFDVDWAPVDDEECEQIFAEEAKDGAVVSEDEADEATHPSTQDTAGQSSEEEASSVEEGVQEDANREEETFTDDNGEDHPSSRPSWGTDDPTEEPIPKDSRPLPYTPSPATIAKTQVENLSPGTSRLATFSSGLKLRFSDASCSNNNSPSNENKVEDDGFPQEAPWSGDDADEDDEGEAEGGDAFSAEVKTTKDARPHAQKLGRELSTNWMNFDDDKWDSSKHSEERLERQTATKENATTKKASLADATTEPTPAPTLLPAKMKTDEQIFSLEARLAKVSKNTKRPSMAFEEEQNGGVQTNDVISFWGEGQEDEDSANDPLAIALKAKHAEQPHDRSDERKLYDSNTLKSPKSSYSQLSSPRSSVKSAQQQPAGSGWLQKGLGSAMNLVASNLSNLPFTKLRDTDEPIKDYNVEEVIDTPLLDCTNAGSSPPLQPTERPLGRNASLAEVSAMSEDSSFSPRRIQLRGDIPGTVEKTDPFDKIIHGKVAALHQGGPDGYDPVNAVVEKMINQSSTHDVSRGVKFGEETKLVKHSFQIYPVFDLFIDLPHPTADCDTHQSTIYIGAPTEVEDEVEIQSKVRESMQEISCLAFPDHDGSIVQEEQEGRATPLNGKSPMEIEGFQHYTFTLKLEFGALIYAHVRRYLPTHKNVGFRYDVGRRLGRAMVIFTRFPGGGDFFAAVLKTLDAISSQHTSSFHAHVTRPQKWFLQNLYQKHHRLCGHYATNFEDRRGGPHILTLQGLEFADCMEHYAMIDATYFFLPSCLLHIPVIPHMKTSYSCSVLPVMRCLGVVNTLRLFSALLSECRIILVSISPTRLDRSVRAAIAMLSHGMLNWGHTCVPVLPPDLWSMLKSEEPYITGVLAPLAYRLELTDRLGDVVIFNLDENTVTAMGDHKLSRLVPDLCRSLSETMLQKRRIALPENVATEKDMTALAILNSTCDFLAQDLVEILKSDKQTMNGTSVAAKHVAKKAKKVVKSTLNYFWGGTKTPEEDGEQEVVEVKKTKQEKKMEPDAIYIEGCRNEAGEEAARLAFVSFFLRMLGNHEGYVYETEESDFNFNKEEFLRQRKERGDGGGSPMWNMLINFCGTQMVRDWVKMREQHIRGRQPIPVDAPLFWQCMDFLEVEDIDFGILNVRSVARMMLQKTSIQQMLPSNVRRLSMALTSKRKFEGNLDNAMADLAELSRESGSALYDVMSVIWLRSRDCKGLQWVHGYQAMRVLKGVLLHGPLAAVADATDGIQRIRTLAFRKSQGWEHIQDLAIEIYNLLSDRSKLFLRRRVAAEQRRRYRDSDDSRFVRESRLTLNTPFKELHTFMNPSLRLPEPSRRRASLSSRRASLSSRLPHRLSITKHIMALEPHDGEESINSFSDILPIQGKASRHNDFLHDTLHRPSESQNGSLGGDLATARRYVREISRKTQEKEKERTREQMRRRDSNAVGVELLRKQFMLLKVAIYLCPIFYLFGNHEHFLAIVMFLWLSQQFQVFRAPIDSGALR